MKLVIFFLIFSLTFPVIGYALTPGSEMDTGNISHEDLMQAGIILNNADSQNITRAGGWVNFDVGDQEYRVKWNGDDEFIFRTPTWLIGWIIPVEIDRISEAEVLSEFDVSYNWSHFTIDNEGNAEADALFTVYPGCGNITYTIAVGNITLTIGRGFDTGSQDTLAFGNWFLGLVFGWDTGGMPDFFVWVVRLIALIGLASAVLLVREFIPLLP